MQTFTTIQGLLTAVILNKGGKLIQTHDFDKPEVTCLTHRLVYSNRKYIQAGYPRNWTSTNNVGRQNFN